MGQYEQGIGCEPVIGHPAPYYQQAGSYAQAGHYGPAPNYDDQRPMPNTMGGVQNMPVPPMAGPEAPRRVSLPGFYTGKWTTNLCGCCGDCNSCCLTCWCPCISFGQVAEVVDEGQSSCLVHGAIYALLLSVGFPCIYSCMWRTKLRHKYQLEQGCCGDFGTHCCCELCAICQEHRELKNRGFDPILGWEANRVNYVQPMAVPTPPGVMMK